MTHVSRLVLLACFCLFSFKRKGERKRVLGGAKRKTRPSKLHDPRAEVPSKIGKLRSYILRMFRRRSTNRYTMMYIANRPTDLRALARIMYGQLFISSYVTFHVHFFVPGWSLIRGHFFIPSLLVTKPK